MGKGVHGTHHRETKDTGDDDIDQVDDQLAERGPGAVPRAIVVAVHLPGAPERAAVALLQKQGNGHKKTPSRKPSR